MNKCVMALAGLALAGGAFAVQIDSVSVRSRAPWDKKLVDIDLTISGSEQGAEYIVDRRIFRATSAARPSSGRSPAATDTYPRT